MQPNQCRRSLKNSENLSSLNLNSNHTGVMHGNPVNEHSPSIDSKKRLTARL
jgi:hypothetical protein